MSNHNILVINAGSTSIKFQIVDPVEKIVHITGIAENIGLKIGNLDYTILGKDKVEVKIGDKKYEEIIKIIYEITLKVEKMFEINVFAIGHRFVQGGECFDKSIFLNSKNEKQLLALNDLAPLHNPVNYRAYKLLKKYFPHVNHVAVFDTSFHTTLPQTEYIYPIPYKYYEKHQIRKYGAHGTNYRYVLGEMQRLLNNRKPNLIVFHLGGGCSVCAIENGKSVATSMGMSPLGGLMMATRSGDLDPTVLQYIMKDSKINDIEETMNILNRESGLKGVSQLSDGSDMRTIEEAMGNNPTAKLAFDLFIKRVIDYLGQYYFLLKGKVDAIVLTAGIGENSLNVRSRILDFLETTLKIKIDTKRIKSRGSNICLTKDDSDISFWIIPANEELVIAQDALKLKET